MDEEKFEENRVKEAAETLLEAREIEKDPVLMKKVKEYLADKKDKIDSLDKLKEKANNFVNDSKKKSEDLEEDDEE